MEICSAINDVAPKSFKFERIEFKTGWNPDDIYYSVCAFANVFGNVGGGYILIGVKEKMV